MTTKYAKTLSGEGEIYKGIERISGCLYELHIHFEIETASPLAPQGLFGHYTSSGVMHLTDGQNDPKAWQTMGPREQLELHLSGSHIWRFIITKSDQTSNTNNVMMSPPNFIP